VPISPWIGHKNKLSIPLSMKEFMTFVCMYKEQVMACIEKIDATGSDLLS